MGQESQDSHSSLMGRISTEDFLWSRFCLCTFDLGSKEKAGATEPALGDAGMRHPRRDGANVWQAYRLPFLEEQAVSRKLLPCLRLFGPFSTIGPTIFYLTQMENRRFPALTSKGCQSPHFQ